MLDLIMRFSPALATAAIVLTNHFMMHRRHRSHIDREAGRLASLLAAELQSVLDHYRDILSLMSSEVNTVLPLRGSGTVFRTNAPRLTGLLEEEVLIPLVACHAHHERIEALMQVCVKPNAGFSLRPDVEDVYVARLRQRLAAGCDLAESAIAALSAQGPVEADDRAAAWLPTRLWFFRSQPRPLYGGTP